MSRTTEVSLPATARSRILAALPDEEFQRLEPELEPVSLDFKDVLYDNDVPIEHVCFPEAGVVSILGVMADGTAVEVATIGNEGLVGLPTFLGAEKTVGQAFVQVPGAGFRMAAAAFRRASSGGALHDVLQRYTQALFTQLAQNSACNRAHSIEERCARWLLMTHDRVGAARFPLTQEFLSQMLGVRRASVSAVASTLQSEGLIDYTRGVITVADRAGLEGAACECYAIIRREFDRLLGAAGASRFPSARELLGTTSKDGKTTLGDGSPRPRPAPRGKR